MNIYEHHYVADDVKPTHFHLWLPLAYPTLAHVSRPLARKEPGLVMGPRWWAGPGLGQPGLVKF